jgi:hypothetical protein
MKTHDAISRVPRAGAIKRRELLSGLAAGAALAVLPAKAKTALPPVQVFKSPTCECCGAWVDHLKAAGFPVSVTEVGDTTAARKRHGLPERSAVAIPASSAAT